MTILKGGLKMAGFIALVLLCAGLAVYVGQTRANDKADEPVSFSMGHFEMVDSHGKTVTDKDFLGKPSVFFFGFTYCPNICPTTLTHLTALMKRLGSDADKIHVVFATVDPERDTPKAMSDYLSSFDRRIIGLTGTPAQVASMAREFYVLYQKVPLGDGDYTMDHSAEIMLFDATGQFKGTIDDQESGEAAFEKLKMLARGGARAGSKS